MYINQIVRNFSVIQMLILKYFKNDMAYVQ